jgi:hypothetical protein
MNVMNTERVCRSIVLENRTTKKTGLLKERRFEGGGRGGKRTSSQPTGSSAGEGEDFIERLEMACSKVKGKGACMTSYRIKQRFRSQR